MNLHDLRFPPSTVPVPVVARVVLDHSNTGIVGSNSDLGMDICPHFLVLCCPVYEEALRWADPPSKESYQVSK